jgi:hypothetical protein
MSLDPQMAAQFLGSLAQISATFFAVYLAILVYILQEKSLARVLLRENIFKALLFVTCAVFVFLIAVCLEQLIELNPLNPYSNSRASVLVLVFI